MSDQYPKKRNLTNFQFTFPQRDSGSPDLQSIPIYNSSSNNILHYQSQFVPHEQNQITNKIKQKTNKQIAIFRQNLNILDKVQLLPQPIKSIQLGLILQTQFFLRFEQIVQKFKSKDFKQQSIRSLNLIRKKFQKRLNVIVNQRSSNLSANAINYTSDQRIWQTEKNKFLQVFLNEQLNEFQNKINQQQDRQDEKRLVQFACQKMTKKGFHIQQNQFCENLSEILNIQGQDVKGFILNRQKKSKLVMRSILKINAKTTKDLKQKKKLLRLATISDSNCEKQIARTQGLDRALFQALMPFKIKQSLKELEQQRKN